MPDFTVIEGDGPRDWPSEYARQTFDRLVIEILRALARGDDSGTRIIKAWNEFSRYSSEASTSPAALIDEQMGEMFSRALRREFGSDSGSSDDRKAILESGLRVVAETLANDPAAKGRLSKRTDDFIRAIESYLLEREIRSREKGWSYTQHLTSRLGPWPPSPAPKATPRRPRRPKT